MQTIIGTSKDEPGRMHAMVLLAYELIPSQMDSAFSLISASADLQKSNDLVAKADYYNTLGVYYWYKGDPESAIQAFLPITKMEESPEMLMRLARAYNNIGTLYNSLQLTDSAEMYLHKALRIDEERDSNQGLAKTYYDLSSLYYNQGKLELALRYQLNSIRFNKVNNDTMRLAHCYNVLGMIYSSLDQIENAHESYHTALQMDETTNKTNLAAILYNNLSALYSSNPETFDRALEYANMGLAEAIKKDDYGLAAMLHGNIAASWLAKKEYEKSLNEAHKALSYMPTRGIPKGLDDLYIFMARAHFNLRNYDSARYFSRKALDLSKSSKSLGKQTRALMILFSVDSAQGNYETALTHYQHAILLRDSVWNLENRNHISELQVIYETEKKESENQLLSEQNMLNKRIIRSQKLIMLLGVSVLALLIILLIREHLSKKKTLRQHKEIVKQQEEINRKNASLTELNKTKDKFFSIISHDLRGPFSSLVGLLELLSNEYGQMDDDEKLKIIQLLHENSSNTFNLLVNLLDWARAQTGNLVNKPEKVDLQQVTDKVFNVLETRASQKRLKLINEAPDFSFATADPQLLQSILINLVNNGIKFSEPNNIIRVTAHSYGDYWKICVIDHGIGIPENQIKYLFRLDSNIKRPGTADEPGTGLGLIMVHEFLQLIGGTITVESEPGKGSIFCFTVPV